MIQQYRASATGYQAETPPTPFDGKHREQWLDIGLLPAQDKSLATANLQAQIESYAGLVIDELHAQDACNPHHPSYYDSTPDYDMVVFRGLLVASEAGALVSAPRGQSNNKKNFISALRPVAGIKLQPISTEATTLFVSDRALITVHHNGQGTAHKSPQLCTARSTADTTPHELMLRFLNTQVDAYLALRQPLTDVLDRWQRELLDPRRRFNDWTALLDARLELRKLESLSEEQFDALGELREAWSEPGALPYAAEQIATLRVRLSDVMEHIERVLNHARRLESSVESAIQLHFAAMSHQTNGMVTRLTLMTAVFAPLTLLTGFYGMNVPLPWQTAPSAVWWIVAAMVLLTLLTLASVWWLRRASQRV